MLCLFLNRVTNFSWSSIAVSFLSFEGQARDGEGEEVVDAEAALRSRVWHREVHPSTDEEDGVQQRQLED